MGLNLTSTAPSAIATSFFTHQGNAPLPDCLRTLGALGAVPSASMAHFGAPRPVTPATHPAGRVPTRSLSKLIVSAATSSVVSPGVFMRPPALWAHREA